MAGAPAWEPSVHDIKIIKDDILKNFVDSSTADTASVTTLDSSESLGDGDPSILSPDSLSRDGSEELHPGRYGLSRDGLDYSPTESRSGFVAHALSVPDAIGLRIKQRSLSSFD